MGDFNIDLLRSESCDYANYFTEQLFTSSFFPLITKATRITHHTATLIDNIFTNNLEQFADSADSLLIIRMGLRWRSGQSARLSPLRLRVRFSERTFSMLLEPSASLM